ncbi:MAG: GtrA family protein [Prevotellaceae bacterium]|jgi:putative flippase GtrA|nr:GtrA family protein [Prevotellaceae bacterium]
MFRRFFIFLKAQMSAFIGGMSHLGIAFVLTKLFGKEHYLVFYTIAQIIGAVINFTLNKTWSFYSKDSRYKFSLPQQFGYFVITVVGSILLKDLGSWGLTEYIFTQTSYQVLPGIPVSHIYIGWLLAEITVSLGFNYTMQRLWVFKKLKAT